MIRPRRPVVVGSSSFRLGHIVGLGRYRVLRNSAGVARRETPWRSVSQAVLVVPGVALFVLALSMAFALSLGSAGSVESARSLLTMQLLAGFVACFAGSLSTTLQSLYLGQDVRFLITLPVPLKTLFLTKLPDLALGAIPGALFLVSIGLGQLLGRAAAPAYLPFAVAALLTLLVTGLGLSAIVTALVVRAAPARLTRASLLLVSIATVLGVGLLSQRLVASAQRSGTIGRAELLSGATRMLDYTPAGWASMVLTEATLGHHAAAASWLGLLVGVAMLCVAAASTLFAVTYMRTFERVESSGGVAVTHRAPSWTHPLRRLIPLHLLPWVKREWMLMGRDLRRLSAAVWPASTVAAYLVATLIRDTHRTRPADERFWLTYGVLAAVPWAISMGTVLFATGGEGREIALVRSLPVRSRTIIAAKLFAYLFPTVSIAVASAVVVVTATDGISVELAWLVCLTVWVAVGCSIVDFAASAVAPSFDAEHIQRSTGLLGRVVSVIAGGLFLLLTVAGVAFMPGTGGAIGRAVGTSHAAGQPVTAALILMLATLVPAFMLLVARDRYRHLLGER